MGLSVLFAGTGRPAEAVRLAGALDSTITAAGIAFEPVVDASHRAMLDELRVVIGQAAFAKAWSAGQSLSLGEAVAEARSMPG